MASVSLLEKTLRTVEEIEGARKNTLMFIWNYLVLMKSKTLNLKLLRKTKQAREDHKKIHRNQTLPHQQSQQSP